MQTNLSRASSLVELPINNSPLRVRSIVIWPIVKRLPTYLKLAWALIKEPAILWRHKAPLYSVLLYEISPPHLAIAAIPVVGQLDTVILLVLGIRHTMAHCPPNVMARHLSNLNLTAVQIDEDIALIRKLVSTGCSKKAREYRGRLLFAGRVVCGFTRRSIARCVAQSS